LAVPWNRCKEHENNNQQRQVVKHGQISPRRLSQTLDKFKTQRRVCASLEQIVASRTSLRRTLTTLVTVISRTPVRGWRGTAQVVQPGLDFRSYLPAVWPDCTAVALK
jgi:hypothetical protein